MRLRWLLILILALPVLVGDGLRLTRAPLEAGAFGVEYGHLAANLAQTGEFANAMGVGGPSAWMPPLLVVLMALVFRVTGVMSLTSLLVLHLIKDGLVVMSWWWLLDWSERGWGRRGVLAVGGLALLWRILDTTLTREFHDHWLTSVLVVALLLALERPRRSGLALALALPLVHPILALAAMLAGCLWPLSWNQRRAAGLAMLASIGLWMSRNQLVLGHAYPVKSNLWFDFVLANLDDDDGLLTRSTLLQYHPAGQNAAHQLFAQVGESEFLRLSQQRLPSLSQSQWGQRCLNRAANALWFTQPELDLWPARDLTPPQQRTLEASGAVAGGCWTYMQRPLELEPSLQALREGARSQWQQAQGRVGGYCFAALPALATLVVWWGRRDRQGRALCLLYVAYLAPYVLIQHYERYQMAIAPLQWVLLTWAILGPPPGVAGEEP